MGQPLPPTLPLHSLYSLMATGSLLHACRSVSYAHPPLPAIVVVFRGHVVAEPEPWREIGQYLCQCGDYGASRTDSLGNFHVILKTNKKEDSRPDRWTHLERDDDMDVGKVLEIWCI